MVIVLVAVPVGLLLFGIRYFFGWVPYIVVSAILLETTFAVKCMRQYTVPIAEAIRNKDFDKARQCLDYIVRRDPNKLSEQ